MKKNLGLVCGVLTVLATVPAVAQTDVLVVDGTSVGILESTPATTLHIVESDDTKANRVIVRIAGTDFYPQFEYQNEAAGHTWRLGVNPLNNFVINEMADPSTAEMRISPDGDLFANGTELNVPDYVFDEGYELRSLDSLRNFIEDNGHLPNVFTEADRQLHGGVNIAKLPLQVLEKVEELTLYTLQQHDQIRELEAANQELLDRLAQLEARVGRKDRRR